MTDSRVKLGVKAEDKVSGFQGIVIGLSQWLTGCDQVCLKPKVGRDGKIRDGQWFDEGQVVYLSKGLTAKDVKSKTNGGPQPDAPKA